MRVQDAFSRTTGTWWLPLQDVSGGCYLWVSGDHWGPKEPGGGDPRLPGTLEDSGSLEVGLVIAAIVRGIMGPRGRVAGCQAQPGELRPS